MFEAVVCVQASPSMWPGDCGALLLVLEQLKELQGTLKLQLGCRGESCRFTPLAVKINKNFFIFYVTAVSIFLPLIFVEWMS